MKTGGGARCYVLRELALWQCPTCKSRSTASTVRNLLRFDIGSA
jgi:lipopolysaccharide biosynthesis regulator YciM